MSRRDVPIILQNEISECGLACLAMICGAHGKVIGLQELRGMFDPGSRGSSLKDIAHLGERLGFNVKAMKVGLNQVGKLELPAIIHWEIVHYVVLIEVRGGTFLVNDPASGRRELSREEFSSSFTGLAQELSPKPDINRSTKRETVKLGWLLSGFSGYDKVLGAIFGTSIAMQALLLALPFAVQLVIGGVAYHGFEGYGVAAVALGGVVGIGAYALLLRMRATLVMFLATSLDTSGSQRLIEKMFGLPYEFFARRDVGSLLNRFSNLREVRFLLTQGLAESVVEALLSLAALLVLGLYLPVGVVAAVAAVGAYAGYRWLVRGAQRDALAEMFHLFGAQNGSLIESMQKISTIKANALEKVREGFWIARYMRFQDSVVRKLRRDVANQVAMSIAFSLGYLTVGLSALHAVSAGTLTMAEGLTSLLLVGMFMSRSSSFVERFFDVMIARVHLDGLVDVVHSEDEPTDGKQVASIEGKPVAIELRGVGFRYSSSEPFILRNVNMRVSAGECVALTGPSGCGKSTLMAMLLGLRLPTEGEILIDGAPLRSISLSDYRRATGSVMQGDRIFYGTVLENVSLFELDAPDQRVNAALELALISDVIDKLPMREHTMLSDAPMLSGGETQRLLLARALYKRPGLLLLDEASSALDDATEAALNEVLRNVGATRIMIAHREHTIAAADRIITIGYDSDICCSTVMEGARSGHQHHTSA